MPFLDIHAIQSVPPANINRDENGSPKTAVYGGAQRLRVSSQAWKRAARREMESSSADIPESRRTKRLPEEIAEEIATRAPALAEHASAIAQAALSNIFSVKSTPKKKDGRERVSTGYLLFLGVDQQARLVDKLLAAQADLLGAAGNSKNLEKVLKDLKLRDTVATGHPPAVALFGRMIADDPSLNVDAACQVAHAISTHAVEAEFDYYTAVDDIDSEADETGAGMIGTVEFNAATMYRYATVDLRSLADNLGGDTDYATETAIAFARAFLLSMPTGKRNTFANNTRPDFVLLSLRDDQPVSLAGAFERPVGGESGHVATSVKRLLRHHAKQDEAYETAPVLSTATYPAWLSDEEAGFGTGLPESQPLSSALDAVRGKINQLMGAADA
ncbi:type I-E CRISPR-associated protein Cas7/Cse4/CasC [Nocardiopsis rhodophaea]|uniref:Type I-E CRISPR-associated protein Cas7/Cse4/CasC n=1 Tax=Nocardiopsis rhodophaea TaxID=280238 RepID=A0ABP5E7I4_9ACTN